MDPWGATEPMAWWTLINRAHALENFAYVVAANQGASLRHYPPYSWPGGSQVVDFDGRLLAEASPGPGERIVVAPIDISALRHERQTRVGHHMPPTCAPRPTTCIAHRAIHPGTITARRSRMRKWAAGRSCQAGIRGDTTERDVIGTRLLSELWCTIDEDLTGATRGFVLCARARGMQPRAGRRVDVDL